MGDRATIAQLYRRAGFGLAPGELDDLEALGVDTVIDRMVDPDGSGVAPTPEELWSDLEFPLTDSTRGAFLAVDRWLEELLTTPRPFEEWMAWYWHGHLVSSMAEVANVRSMTNQIELFRRLGLGSFPELLRAVTIDPAMLGYLNGDESTGTNPNENYAREMLELFALGFGAFTEADVAAGALALTGWRVRVERIESPVELVRAVSWFDPTLHDDAPQQYLGRNDVHDVDTAVAAAVTHEECAPFVAGRFGGNVLGPDVDPEVIEALATRFRDADLDLRVLARATLEAVADGYGTPMVLGPMPWLLAAQRATSARLDASERYQSLYDVGHAPFWPPNVGGWPGGETWLATSTTAERFNLAGVLAAAAPDGNPAREAARAGELGALADALGRPEGFSAPTEDALVALHRRRPDDGVAVLTVALAAPDLVIA